MLVGAAFAAGSVSWIVAGRRSRARAQFLDRNGREKTQSRYWHALAAKNDLTGALFLTVAIAVLGVAAEEDVRMADSLLLLSAAPLVVSLTWIERFRWAAGFSETAAERAQQLREGVSQELVLVHRIATHLAATDLETLDLAVESLYFPAEGAIGGDFLGCFIVSGDAVALVVGDVTGHGLEAGIEAMRLKDLLTAGLASGFGPADALALADQHLQQTEVLATAFAAVCDGTKLRYASAGHVSGLVVRRNDDVRLLPTGPILGAVPGAKVEEVTVGLEPADTVVVFTDGLLEAYGSHGGLDEADIAELVRQEGFAQLRDAVNARRHLPLRDDIAALKMRVGGGELRAEHSGDVVV